MSNVIIEQLLGAIEESGLSNADVAIATGLNESTISRIRAGHSVPNGEAIGLIAELLDLELCYRDRPGDPQKKVQQARTRAGRTKLNRVTET